MARVTQEAVGTVAPRSRWRRPSLPRPRIGEWRERALALVVALSLVNLVIDAPTRWIAGLAVLGCIVLAYGVGHADGRRDAVVDVLRDRRDERVARPPIPSDPSEDS